MELVNGDIDDSPIEEMMPAQDDEALLAYEAHLYELSLGGDEVGW